VYQQQIVIVGAGIIGLSTAYALLKQGMQHVTVLEQAAVDHRRATSHGLSRLLRFEYGDDLFYSKLVHLSLQYWKNLERVAKRTLYTQTGLLVLGQEGDNYAMPSYRTLQDLGLSIERLSRRQCIQHFPQFNTQAYDMFTYNKEAGLLQASLCLQTLKDLILDLGGNIFEGQYVTRISNGSQLRPIRLHLADGGEFVADRVVLATGPWVHRLLGDLRLPVRSTRQYILYFANLPPSLFALHAFPAFMASDLYGFPIHNTCTGQGPAWFKASSHAFGTLVDPDELPIVDERIIAQLTQKLCDLLPSLQDAKLAHVDTCMYDVSPDEDFILDYLPGDRRIVFASGLSGHGFKFGLVLGELLSSLLRETEPIVAMERFLLARFARQWCQQESSVA
jgi:monomeric sarcosine oxidase